MIALAAAATEILERAPQHTEAVYSPVVQYSTDRSVPRALPQRG
jgi:hypothetical protein